MFRVRFHAAAALSARVATVLLAMLPGNSPAQIAGDNVNMVSGTQWPGGDPFLQRQNEPTLAVSSANLQHLMAGANDYRSVDIKVPDADVKKMAGDAWLGVFKSLDGGQTWKSVLLPGYPQDPACLSAAPSPRRTLCGLPAAADPVMRSGTDGMFYFAGINFQRDAQRSRVFLARYIDLNNKENGDATRDTDPIRYVDTQIIAENPPGVFIDKPWIAVDVPRAGAAVCEIPVSDNPADPPRRFLGGTLYASWAEFTLPDELTSTIKFTYSRDCGKTWVTPFKISGANSTLSQGVSLAVEPITGRVYAAWRRIASGNQSDAIMVTRSEGRKKQFANARAIAKIIPFDQFSSYTAFRTEAFPTLAISTDGTSSWAHVAWQQRKPTGIGESRILMSTAKVQPPPQGDQDDDEAEDLDDETRLVWSTPAMVADDAITDDAGNVFSVGHQVMPALTFGQGRLMLVYYDSRLDHTRRYYRPNVPFVPTDGRFYQEALAPTGELAKPVAPDTTQPLPVGVYNSWINDGSLYKVRHTVDVRVASARAGGSPSFTSVLASKFPFGIRGDEASYASTGLKVPDMNGGDLTVVGADGKLQLLQQLQLNPPNYPLFKNGSIAFMGDYIDIQGQAFVPAPGGGWAFNSAFTPAPVFHAVWTSNQDVQVPRVLDPVTHLPDWSQYAPPYCPTCNAPEASRYANDGTTQADACVPGAEASRDQNIYTSRITEGLLVTSPQNVKPLGQGYTRAFVILAQNTTSKDMTVAFSASVPAQGTAGAVPEVAYSFTNDLGAGRTSSLGAVVVPARSYVTRSLFVQLTGSNVNPGTTLNVAVTEVGCGQACRSGFVTLNPPTALGSLVQPDTGIPVPEIGAGDVYAGKIAATGPSDPNWTNPGSPNFAPNPNWTNPGWADPNWTNPNWTNPNWTNPSLTNPNWTNPNWTNPNWTNPNWTNPNWTNPNWTNPNWTNPNWTNPNWTNPNWTNPNWTNPNWTNPNWTNPNWTNPNWTNPNWTNSAMSDLSYTLTNTGNTTTSYHLKVVASSDATVNGPLQLDATKFYSTPGAVNCNLVEFPHFLPLVQVPDMSQAFVRPTDQVDPKPTDGAATNVTISLAPGESALITLRANMTLAQMADLGTKLAPAAIPTSWVPNGQTYQDLRGSGIVAVPGAPSKTSLTYDRATGTATVTVTGSGPVPTGTVTIIANGRQAAARRMLDPTGSTSVVLSPALAAGDTLLADYAGDTAYASSTSAPVTVQGSAQPTVTLTYNEVRTLPPKGFATVVVDGGNTGTPTGSVTLYLNGAQFATLDLPVSSGPTASVNFWFNPVASPGDQLIAVYSGDSTYPSASSNPLTVALAATTTTLSFDVLSSTATVFVSVPPIAGKTPTGTVTLYSNGVPLTTVTPTGSGNTLGATVTLSPRPAAGETITATYSGDGTYASSGCTPVTVGRATPTATVSYDIVNSSVTVSVAAGVSPAPTPTGSVTLTRNGTLLTTLALTGTSGSAQATDTLSRLSAGDVLVASYQGDGIYTPMDSSLIVSLAGTWTMLKYDPVTSTADVGVGSSATSIAPTGAVDLFLDGAPIASLSLTPGANGGSTGTTPPLSPSPAVGKSLVGAYSGDPIFAPSSSVPWLVTGFSAASPVTTARRFHAAVTVGTQVFVLGGRNPSLSGSLLSVEAFDTATVSWTARSAAPVALVLSYGTASAALGTKIYAFTPGVGTYVYDVAADVWSQQATLTPAFTGDARAVAAGSRIYLVTDAGTQMEIFEYDPVTDTFTPKAALANGRFQFSVAEAGGKVYVLGGMHAHCSSNCIGLSDLSIDEFDPAVGANGTWTTMPVSFTSPTEMGSAATVNGKIYFFGGGGYGPPASTVRVLDPVARSLSDYAVPWPSPRYGMAAASVAGHIYVTAGVQSGSDTTAVDDFFPGP